MDCENESYKREEETREPFTEWIQIYIPVMRDNNFINPVIKELICIKLKIQFVELPLYSDLQVIKTTTLL